MPSITGQPAVDVAIGLFFAFFLLSVLCSAINETIATALAWRSQTLLAGLRSMLADDEDLPTRSQQSAGLATAPEARTEAPAAADLSQGRLLTSLLDHPLIRATADETARRSARRWVPSYLPARAFALALLDAVAPPPAGGHDDVISQTESAVRHLPNEQVKGALTALLRDARGDVDRLRDGIERWFDDTMDRASGWYKRRTQLSMWIIAAAVTLVVNADAGQIASALWKDDALRASVVAQAQQAAQKGDTSDVTKPEPGARGQVPLSQAVDDTRALNLPLGWSFKRDDPRWFDGPGGLLAKLVGLVATTVALTLGAPFWFDLLGRVSRLRGTGKPLGSKAA